MNALSNALANGGLSASDYQGMTPEQIQALAQQRQGGQQMISQLVTELAGNRLKERQLTESERHSKVVEGQTNRQLSESERSAKAREAIQKTQIELENNKFEFMKLDASNKDMLAARRLKIDEDLQWSRKKLMEAQTQQAVDASKNFEAETSALEMKAKNLKLLEDQEVDIGGIKFNAYTVATTPTLTQGWINNLTDKQKVDIKTLERNRLIASGVPEEVVYGMDLGFKIMTPAQVKRELTEKSLSGGISISSTIGKIDEYAAKIAYDHNAALFGKKIADKYDVDSPLTGKKRAYEDPNQMLMEQLGSTVQKAVDAVK